MNLPNTLTMLRIFLVPVLVVVLLTRTHAGLFIGTAIFGLAVATDYLDGFFARRRKQITKLGILLDPIADKLLTSAAFIALVEMGAIPAWMVMIIIGRELAVTGLRNIATTRGILMPASLLGKWKMALQVLAIFLLLLGRRYEVLHLPGIVVLWCVVVVALISAIEYVQFFRREMSRPSRLQGNLEIDCNPD